MNSYEPSEAEKRPSTAKTDYWIWADNPAWEGTEAIHGEPKTGKWMVWVSRDKVDEVWQEIKEATELGALGIQAKVSTTRPNPRARDPNEHVICIYTYDYEDKADVERVRNELRRLGFTAKIGYKTDLATSAGRYGRSSWFYYE